MYRCVTVHLTLTKLPSLTPIQWSLEVNHGRQLNAFETVAPVVLKESIYGINASGLYGPDTLEQHQKIELGIARVEACTH